MMFLDCPAYLDEERTVRCGLPAEVRRRFAMRSTDGHLESAMIRCPSGHWFNGPIECLMWNGRDQRDPADATVAYSSSAAGLTPGHDGRAGRGRSVIEEFPGQPGRPISRPNGAPAYYLGRPAREWVTVMRPRRRRTASNHLMHAVTSG
jgi:hypothetical protein